MKRSLSTLVLVLAAALIAASARTSWAQSPRVIRGDATAVFGWLASDTHAAGPYENHNWVSSFFGAASAGWHWTDNLKTEIDFGAGTESRAFHTEPVTIAGRNTYQTVESRFKRETLGISQQYQFFHNAWFHPHLAAGVNLTRQRQRDEPGQIYFYDAATGTSRFDGPTSGAERTSLTANPFVAFGYKAYVSDRVFFRNDFRIAFRNGPDETVLRLGFGFDF